MIRFSFFRSPVNKSHYSSHRKLTWKSILSILKIFGISLFITGVIFIAIFLFRYKNAPLILIHAQTELVSFIVARPELANIPLYNVELVRHDGKTCKQLTEQNDLFTGLLQPMVGTRITYRHSGEKIVIEIKPGPLQKGEKHSTLAYLKFSDDTRCVVHNRLVIRFEPPASENHFMINARPLPIAGPSEIGKEYGAPLMPRKSGKRTAGLLAGGTLRVFGRATSLISGKEIYPPQHANFIIPKGSRLTSISSRGNNEFFPNSWYGSVTINEFIFDLSATTEAKELRLYRPGRSQDAELFKTSLLAQIFNDPSLAIFSFLFVLFTIILQVVLAFINVLSSGPPMKSKLSAESSNSDGTVSCSDDTNDSD